MQVCRHCSIYNGEQALPGIGHSSCTSPMLLCRRSPGHTWHSPWGSRRCICNLHLQEPAHVQDLPVEQETLGSISIRGEACGPKQEKRHSCLCMAWLSQSLTVGKFHVEFQIFSMSCKMGRSGSSGNIFPKVVAIQAEPQLPPLDRHPLYMPSPPVLVTHTVVSWASHLVSSPL